MKKFILKILFFILPIIVLAVVADIFISSQLRNSKTFAHGELAIWKDIYAGNIDSDIVIYGSSRAWVHIDPLRIEDQLGGSAYNLGVDGHNFWLQHLRHLELLKHNRTPKTIILSVDTRSLQKRGDLYNLEQFLPFIKQKEIRNYTSAYEGFSYLDYQVPFLRYIGKREAMKEAISIYRGIESDKMIRVKGYKGFDEEWNSDFDKAKKKMKYYEVQLDTTSISLFDSFLKECATKKIELIMVYTPEYIEGQEFTKNRSDIIQLFQEKSEQYQFPFLDYSNDTLSYDKQYFYNAMHLNKTGAELFTDKLIEDIQQLRTLRETQ